MTGVGSRPPSVGTPRTLPDASCLIDLSFPQPGATIRVCWSPNDHPDNTTVRHRRRRSPGARFQRSRPPCTRIRCNATRPNPSNVSTQIDPIGAPWRIVGCELPAAQNGGSRAPNLVPSAMPRSVTTGGTLVALSVPLHERARHLRFAAWNLTSGDPVPLPQARHRHDSRHVLCAFWCVS